MKILELKNIKKKYGKNQTIDDVSFTVQDGDIFGILGPSESGKSTIINIISGFINEYDGEAKVFEKDIFMKDVKKTVGIVPQELCYYDKLTVYENVKFFASLYGVSAKNVEKFSEDALGIVSLRDKKNMFPASLSQSMKRRLNIACSLSHRPKLVILDEPTVGIDSESKKNILETIRSIQKNGATVIFTSRFAEEVEEVCNKIVLLDNGKVIAVGSSSELKNEYSMEERFQLEVKEHSEFSLKAFKRVQNCTNINIVNDSVELIMEKDDNNMGNIMLFLVDNNIKIHSLRNVKVDLDNVFFNITGRNLRN